MFVNRKQFERNASGRFFFRRDGERGEGGGDALERLPESAGIDSGDSRSWSGPENAFDDDTSTLWWTFDADVADVAGRADLGMDYGEFTEISGVYLKTDNVVYSVDSMYVDCCDAIAEAWITARRPWRTSRPAATSPGALSN